jgi:Type IV secretion system pilin
MKFVAKVIPVFLLTPMVAFGAGELTGVSTFLQNIIAFMNGTLVPLIFALAFLVFLWGMFKTFILGGSDEGKQAEGKSLMLYAIVGFVIMVSLWGIVNLVANGFGFQGAEVQNIPNLPTNNN